MSSNMENEPKLSTGPNERQIELMKKGLWEQCPRCGSSEVELRGRLYYFLFGFLSIAVGCVFFGLIPFIGFFLVTFGIGMIVVAPFQKGGLHCRRCNLVWKFGKYDKSKDKNADKYSIYGKWNK